MSKKIEKVVGDITEIEVDAIVNAANEELIPGAGVCGAIHMIGGPEIYAECAEIGYCGTGDVAVTTAGDLPAKYVIHAVGPIYFQHKIGVARKLLYSCYYNAIEAAVEHGCKSISFPAISTGIYGYPPRAAAMVADKAIKQALADFPEMERVVLVTYG